MEVLPQPETHHRWRNIGLVLLYAAFIAYQSLADGGALLCSGYVLEWPQHISRVDVLANAVAYVPLGWLGAVAASAEARRRGHRMAFILVSVGLVSLFSCVLEAAQACQSGRVSSAIDWITNSAGAAIGAALALVLPRLIRAVEPARSARTHEGAAEARLRVAAMAVVALWIVVQTLPWTFTADVSIVRRNLAFLQHWQGSTSLDRWNVLRHCGAWLAIAAACRLAASSRLVAIVALLGAAAACLALQVMLVTPSPLTFEELLGIAVAVAGAAPALLLMPRRAGHFRAALLLLTGVVVVVVAHELRPAPGVTQTFSWWPLIGFGERLGALDFAALFAWAGAGVVVAAHAAQRQHEQAQTWRWPVAMLVLALALELAQTRIPGRGPDTSAVLFITLAMLGTRALLRGTR